VIKVRNKGNVFFRAIISYENPKIEDMK